jgi:hypothetical protein
LLSRTIANGESLVRDKSLFLRFFSIAWLNNRKHDTVGKTADITALSA